MTYIDELKLSELVMKDWVHVSSGLVSGDRGKCGRLMRLDILLWGILVGRFKCGKMG